MRLQQKLLFDGFGVSFSPLAVRCFSSAVVKSRHLLEESRQGRVPSDAKALFSNSKVAGGDLES
jgi:hypothetical protein